MTTSPNKAKFKTGDRYEASSRNGGGGGWCMASFIDQHGNWWYVLEPDHDGPPFLVSGSWGAPGFVKVKEVA